MTTEQQLHAALLRAEEEGERVNQLLQERAAFIRQHTAAVLEANELVRALEAQRRRFLRGLAKVAVRCALERVDAKRAYGRGVQDGRAMEANIARLEEVLKKIAGKTPPPPALQLARATAEAAVSPVCSNCGGTGTVPAEYKGKVYPSVPCPKCRPGWTFTIDEEAALPAPVPGPAWASYYYGPGGRP